jgi:hypothetical protein
VDPGRDDVEETMGRIRRTLFALAALPAMVFLAGGAGEAASTRVETVIGAVSPLGEPTEDDCHGSSDGYGCPDDPTTPPPPDDPTRPPPDDPPPRP